MYIKTVNKRHEFVSLLNHKSQQLKTLESIRLQKVRKTPLRLNLKKRQLKSTPTKRKQNNNFLFDFLMINFNTIIYKLVSKTQLTRSSLNLTRLIQKLNLYLLNSVSKIYI